MAFTAKIKEINNVKEFKEYYLQNSDYSYCAECNHLEYAHGNGFLEIIALEDLQKLHSRHVGHQARRKFYSIILLTAGNVEEVIGHQKYHFGPQSMYFIPENQIHSIESWSEDVQGFLCMFDADYFLLCIKHQITLNQFPFFQLDKVPYVDLSERETGMMQHLFWKLNSEKCQKKTFNDDLLVRMFLNIILLEAERIHNHTTLAEPFNLSRKEQLVAQFQLLVNQHFLEKKQVKEYAGMLNVHPHYLNDVVKEVSGFSASYFIQKQLIQEAKSRLMQTNDTVSMIATELNFTDDSYFGRFFKKMTGLTPLHYRRKHKHQ
ncbi:AraC family transcriptional regulator [Pedobacter lusitanus]|uniref:AraC family transcriptional regulator n=1 Tax=Pedobacter lusitanus TaxID=1503925 RepID=A0A0D0GM17_9SPHI|nr:helix-turn-helix domain-containing protein [Pedobacter lusitanus]KIO78277.1 AraC family transcriptional regulator [Pedobacter lusitanus]